MTWAKKTCFTVSVKATWQASTDVVWCGLTDVVCQQTPVSSLSTPWFLRYLFCEHILALLTRVSSGSSVLWGFQYRRARSCFLMLWRLCARASVSKVTVRVAVCRRSQANLHFVRVLLPVFCFLLLKDIAVAFDCDISWVCPLSVGWKSCLGALKWKKVKKKAAKLINYWHWFSTFAHVRLCVCMQICAFIGCNRCSLSVF